MRRMGRHCSYLPKKESLEQKHKTSELKDSLLDGMCITNAESRMEKVYKVYRHCGSAFS